MSAKHYREPDTLPGGWWETLQPLASWIQSKLCAAYNAGYNAGLADAAREWRDIVDHIGKPPTGCACVT